MKVALVHDYLKEYGGAERVLEALHDIYPKADVFTTVYLPSYLGPHKERFKDWTIKTSFLQWIPFKAKLISPLRLLSPLAFSSFDFSGYDVIISSATGAYFPNALRKQNAKLICYCHTPPRYLYGYKTAREWKNNAFLRVVGELANHILRLLDKTYSKNVDYYIANSKEVASRIEKFYRRDAKVIYPPVDLRKDVEVSDNQGEKYFLTGGRLARAKNVDVIIKACVKNNMKLKVFGKGFGGYGEELKKMANQDIEFLGEVTDEEKFALMRGAKAFLFASEDEDFGITPVEAMGQGLPVIAYFSGGVKETIIDGKTGLFFHDLTAESLKEALVSFEKKRWSKDACRERAKEFSEETFKKQISSYISSITA